MTTPPATWTSYCGPAYLAKPPYQGGQGGSDDYPAITGAEAAERKLDAQPAPVRDAFNYLLCLLMAERGALRLVETHPAAADRIDAAAYNATNALTVAATIEEIITILSALSLP